MVDLFVDSVDIHDGAKRRKPLRASDVRFFDISLIEAEYTGRLWVTKFNLTKWEGLPRSGRWFSSKSDLESNFKKGEFDQMIFVRHSGGELPFNGHLKRIVLDDPYLTDQEIDCYSMAFGALRLSMTEGGLDVPNEKRACHPKRTCVSDYNNNL